jgi:hypothetical protein
MLYSTSFNYIHELEPIVEESGLQPPCYAQAVSCLAAFFIVVIVGFLKGWIYSFSQPSILKNNKKFGKQKVQ